MTQQIQFPTEVIDLPSKGLLYPESSPLHSGTIELKYMTAKEEDILTNQNYIQKGIVFDKLLQSLIVTEGVNYEDILIGDKNAILVAARILGYGSEYIIEYGGKKESIDLSQIENKSIDEDLFKSGTNEFPYILPYSKVNITFKLLTHKDEQEIEAEIRGIRKFNKDASPELSTRLKFMILSVEGRRDTKTIRDFVDGSMLARDSRAFREYVRNFQPDIDMRFYPEEGPEGGVDIPMGVTFFWPDAGV